MLLKHLPLALLACSLLACPGDPAEPPGGAAGGGGAVTTLSVSPANFVREDEPMRMLSDGSPLQLWNASQGGHVALIGAQIEGVAGDTIELRARLSDPATGFLVAEEARTVLVRPVPGSASLKQTDIRTRSQMTHVPLCPNYDSKPVIDEAYDLEVIVTELYTTPPRKGSARVRVTPTCGDLTETPEVCRCECRAGYTLGSCD